MKKKILLVSVLICVGISIFGMLNASAAESGTCGTNLTYTLDENGTLTISGKGDMSNWNGSSNPPWHSSKKQIFNIVIEDGVTSIGEFAFDDYDSLTNITIPDSVTSIGRYAFDGCDSLQSITIPSSVISIGSDAFRYCDNLTTVNIADIVAWCNITWGTRDSNPLSYGNAKLYLDGKLTTNLILPDNVKQINNYAFTNCSSLTSISIPDSVSSIGIEAFWYCNNLTSVIIPESVSEIGARAFYNCKSLKELTLSSQITEIKNETFYNCTSLSSIQIPDRVKIIGLSAFKNCSGLTEVILPEGLTKIRNSAFYECRNLYKINIPSSVVTMEDNAFVFCYNMQEVYIADLSAWVGIDFETYDANPLHYGDAKLYLNNTLVSELCIPNGVEKIGDYAFTSCTGFNNVVIPTSIKQIGVGAFAYNPLLDIYYDDTSSKWKMINISTGNSSIDSAVIHCTDTSIGYAPESDFSAVNGAIIDYLGTANIVRVPEKIGGSPVTTIADSAFYGNSITQITLPEGVTSIGNSAFYNCKKLTYIRIPDAVKSIGNSAFYYCEALTSITLPDSVERIGTSSFRNCYALQKVSLSSNITSIPEYAFYYCESLESINIPSKITSIGNYAFSSCSKIKGIAFPDSITRIGTSAFSFCSELNTVDFSDNISAIGSDAFRGCTAITEIELPTALKNIASMSFYGCSNLKSVTIPSRVTYIDSSAFYNCYLLEKLDIGHRLSSIYSNAFYGCYGLKTIDYACGEEDWNNISVSSTGNECLSSATVNYKNTYLVDYNLNSGAGDVTYSIAKLGESITITDLIPYREQYEFLGWSTSTSSSTDILYNAGDSYTGTANTTLYAIWRRIPIVLYSGTCGDNLTWTLDDEKNLIISGTGEMDSYTFMEGAPWENYNTKIEHIKIEDGVESIGAYAFYGLTEHKSVSIAPSIKRIEESAIGHMSYTWTISSLYIYDLDAWCKMDVSKEWYDGKAFEEFYCNGEPITQLVIPETVSKINNYVFKYFDKIEQIVLHENVTNIGEGAFQNCWNVKSVNLPSKLQSIGARAFLNNSFEQIELPEGITRIEDYTFYACNSLKNITIPNGVVYIGEYAFNDCDSLESVYIPNTVSSIGKSAFGACNKLKNINIPASISTIPEYMLSSTDIEEIKIPLNVTKIEDYAFNSCDSLTNVYYEGSVNLWNKIPIGSGNNYLTKASFTFGNLDILQIIYNYNCEEPNYEQTVSPNTSVTISAPIPTRTNYKFLGWAKSANASKPDYKTGDSVSIATEDVTLYAVWQRIVVTNTSVISNIIMVTPTNAQIGDCIIAACYKEERMVYVDTYSYNGETTIPFIPNVEYDTIKIMVWESLSNLKPLSDVEEL